MLESASCSFVFFALAGFGANAGVTKMKLTGYLTATTRVGEGNLMILDDLHRTVPLQAKS